MTGAFIAFEGPEGAGKSTQAAALAARLRGAGHEVVLSREPGGTAEGEALRALLLDPAHNWTGEAEALLMNAARAQHLSGVIRPALDRGAVVITDRFSMSTRAYQGGGGGVDDAFLAALEAQICQPSPDLTLVFDLPPEEGMARAHARGQADRFEQRPMAYHLAVAARFRELAAGPGAAAIDARGTPDDVGARVDTALRQALPGLLETPHGA